MSLNLGKNCLNYNTVIFLAWNYMCVCACMHVCVDSYVENRCLTGLVSGLGTYIISALNFRSTLRMLYYASNQDSWYPGKISQYIKLN